jgi:hypothetical protein
MSYTGLDDRVAADPDMTQDLASDVWRRGKRIEQIAEAAARGRFPLIKNVILKHSEIRTKKKATMERKVTILSVLIVMVIMSGCSGLTVRKSYKKGDKLPFAETPENFTGYLNSLNWGVGKEVNFEDLARCETWDFDIFHSYICKQGIVTEKTKLGVKVCSVQKVVSSTNHDAIKEGRAPSTEYTKGECRFK